MVAELVDAEVIAEGIEVRRVTGTDLRIFRVDVDGARAGSVEFDGRMWATTPVVGRVCWFTTRDQATAWLAAQSRHERDRWQRALDRAIAAGVDVFEVAGEPDSWVVESATKAGTVYKVTGSGGGACSCQAGQAGDRICLHRAAVRGQLGILPVAAADPDPDPDPAAAAVPEACPVCEGEFVRGNLICRTCRGTGRADMVDPDFLEVMRRRTG